MVSKMRFNKSNKNFRVELSSRKKRTTFSFQMFGCCRKFSTGTGFNGIFSANDKQPGSKLKFWQ